MSSRLIWFNVVIPANTPIATPLVTPTMFNAGGVSRIELVFPPGPAGNVGVQVWSGGGQYWPTTPGEYVVLDNDHPMWDLDNAPNNGSWALVGYNTDLNDHLIQVGYSVFENVATTTLAPSGYVSV